MGAEVPHRRVMTLPKLRMMALPPDVRLDESEWESSENEQKLPNRKKRVPNRARSAERPETGPPRSFRGKPPRPERLPVPGVRLVPPWPFPRENPKAEASSRTEGRS